METTILTPDGVERAVLHTLMWGDRNDFLEQTNGLTADHFYNRQYGMLFDVLKSRHLRGLPLTDADMVVKDMVEQGAKEFSIIDIMQISNDVPMILNLRENVLTIINLSQRRQLDSLFVRLQQQVNDRTQDTTQVVATAVEEMLSGVGMTEERTIKLSEVLNNIQQRMDDNRNDIIRPGLLTGFERLDRYGGMHPGDLIVIAADSSQGKTALAINMLVNAARESKARAVVYSMEMSATQLGARILSPETNLPASVITYRKLSDQSYQEAIDGINNLQPVAGNIYFGDASVQTLSSIISSIRLHHARFGVNIVLVDYLQIIGHEPGWNGKTEEALADTARRLKNIAKELDIVVLLLSQINREGAAQGFNMPSASRLRGSGQINEAADLTMLIYRPEVYGSSYPAPFQNESTHATAMLKIDKDRYGAYGGIGSFIVHFNGSTTKFGPTPTLPYSEGDSKTL